MDDNLVEKLEKKRTDIQKERQEVLETLARHQERVRQLDKALAAIDSLLSLEGERPDAPEADASDGGQSLRDFLLESLSGRGPCTTHELLEEALAADIDFNGKIPYKTVNMTLLGMSRGRQVKRTAPGTWIRVN
jgi:hypothetical protein